MFEVCNNRVYRIGDKFVVLNNIFGLEPKVVTADELDDRFETVYQIQTAKECLEVFSGMVDKNLITDVKGRTHFDAASAKIVIELQGVNVEAPQTESEEKEVTEELKLEKEEESK